MWTCLRLTEFPHQATLSLLNCDQQGTEVLNEHGDWSTQLRYPSIARLECSSACRASMETRSDHDDSPCLAVIHIHYGVTVMAGTKSVDDLHYTTIIQRGLVELDLSRPRLRLKQVCRSF